MAIEVDFIKRSGSRSDSGYKVIENYGVRDTANAQCNLGPVAVMALSGIPKLGQTYAPSGGCDTAVTSLVVTDVSVGDPVSDNVHCWVIVTITYTEPQEQLPKGFRPHPQHNTSDDPIDWKPELVIRKQPVVSVKETALFLGAWQLGATTYVPINNGVVNMPISTEQYVQNAAGTVDTSLTDEKYDMSIDITIYTAEWDQNVVYTQYENSVNDDDVRIHIPEWNYNRTFGQYSLKMGAITGTPGYREWRNNAGTKMTRTYWRTTFNVLFRNSLWITTVANEGLSRVYRDATNAIPDGLGGTMVNADFKPGQAWVGPIYEGNKSFPITEPVPLDLAGQPLAGRTARYALDYLDGHEKDWLNPNLGAPFFAVGP